MANRDRSHCAEKAKEPHLSKKAVQNGESVPIASTDHPNGRSPFENLLPGTYRVEITDATPCTFVQEVVIPGVQPLQVTAATAQPVGCSTSDGEITLTVTVARLLMILGK
jgi:hypothetical protein